MNVVQTAVTNTRRIQEAIDELPLRSLLVNIKDSTIGIVWKDPEDRTKKQRMILSALPDEVNLTLTEDHKMHLKEDIVIDSVTTQADHEGVDWKSQSVIGETTEDRTILLICAKDNDKETGMVGFFGGEIVELGEEVESHYQVSLTSTGSRLIKGATTNAKKAKPCLVKYNGDYYYGLHFKESSPAKIYFAGWSNIPGPLSAPSYTTYVDGDFSEVIDLDDDSETGTEVIEMDFSSLADHRWEFFDEFERSLTSNRNVNFRNNFATVGSGNNRYYNMGNGFRLYPVNRTDNGRTSTVELHPEWSSVTVEGIDVTNIRFDITDDIGYLTLNVKNWGGMNGLQRQGVNVVIYPDDGTGNGPNTGRQIQNHYFPADTGNGTNGYTSEFTFGPLDRGTYWVRQGSGIQRNTKIEYYTFNVQNYSINVGEIAANGDHYNYDLGYGLKIKTHENTYWDAGSNGNRGAIICEAGTSLTGTEGLAQLEVFGPCTLKIGFSRLPGNEAPSSMFLITDEIGPNGNWAAGYSTADDEGNAGITEVTYNYNGEWGKAKTLYFVTDTPVIWYYADVDYPSFNGGEIIAQIIETLKETSEDGSPHIIRPEGTLYKADLLRIAAVCLNSERQLVVDLSRCDVAADARDWSGDDDLSKLFQGCSSIHKFCFPSGVVSGGRQPFLNCSFLREIEFNDEMNRLGFMNWQSANQGYFSGARIKQVWLPKNLGNGQPSSGPAFGAYMFAQNNILGYYIRPDSYYAVQKPNINNVWNQNFGGGSHVSWATLAFARADMKIYLPCKKLPNGNWDTSNDWLYNRWRSQMANSVIVDPYVNDQSQLLSNVTANVPSLRMGDRVRDLFAPYDVNEEWYIPRDLETV